MGLKILASIVGAVFDERDIPRQSLPTRAASQNYRDDATL